MLRISRILFPLVAVILLLSVACQTQPGRVSKLTEIDTGQRELRILQWNHFVPRYDEWLDSFAQEWGEENGVIVSIDHVNVGELKPLVDAEIAMGEGHDMFELVSPPSNLETHVIDLTDINLEAQRMFGQQIELCTRSSYNATTNKFYGFCHGWVPDPGDYRRSLWEVVNQPEGPASWDDLLDSGSKIKDQLTIQMGIGMSHELDSNMAGRSLIWAFGGSVQDEHENVVINSPETVAAVKYMVELYQSAMTDEVFEWNAASNNKALIAARVSYILNSVSAYRTAQKSVPEVADDVFFVPPLMGPTGERKASAHIFNVYVVPKYSQNSDIAKEFILALTENYDQAVYNSELYNFPAFFSTAPQLMAADGWLDIDPFESNPPDKLAFLKDAPIWSTNVGYPGSANAAIGEVYDSFIIPDMFAKAAKGEMTPEEAVAWAESEIAPIFEKWRAEGLVGGAD